MTQICGQSGDSCSHDQLVFIDKWSCYEYCIGFKCLKCNKEFQYEELDEDGEWGIKWLNKRYKVNREMNLEEYLKTHKYIGPFKPGPRYNIDRDFIEIYWFEEEGYTKRMTPEFDLIRAIKGDQIIGCKIYGIKNLIKESNYSV